MDFSPGIDAKEMHETFRGEAIYCAEVERNFPILTARKCLVSTPILADYPILTGWPNSPIRGRGTSTGQDTWTEAYRGRNACSRCHYGDVWYRPHR